MAVRAARWEVHAAARSPHGTPLRAVCCYRLGHAWCGAAAAPAADDALADLVRERYDEALGGDIRMNCDTCAYRVLMPGFADKVGRPQQPQGPGVLLFH